MRLGKVAGDGAAHSGGRLWRDQLLFVILCALTLLMLPPAELLAQTAAKGIPANRPDQLPSPAPPRAGASAAVKPAGATPPAAITPFTLTAVRIEGSTLPPAMLAPAYGPFVGRTIDQAALVALTNAVAAAYAKSDLALYSVLVPEQRFGDGPLRLTIVEGYVGAVEVRGHLRQNRLKLLRAYLRRLEQERPLHTATLQRVVSLIRDMPGFFPEVTLEAGQGRGAVKFVVNAREKPVQLSFGANSRGTALLGRTQGQADLLVNGLFGGADQLRLTTVLPTHVSRFQYVAGTYSTPLDADGTMLSGTLSRLRTRPAAFPLKGDATSFGMQLSRPVIRSYTRNLYATLGFDGLNSNNALLGYTLSNDRTRAARLGLSYTAASTRNQITLSATGSIGLDVLGARRVAGLSRQGFRKLNLRVNDALALGKSFALRLNGFAQITPDDLPSSEFIALGGDEFGRAYEGALISGDRGYAGSAEFAWRPATGLPKLLAGSELYAFADHGRTYYRSRFGLPATSSHLASVGAGGRVQVAARTILQMEAARGLNDPVFYADHTRTRVVFSVRSVL